MYYNPFHNSLRSLLDESTELYKDNKFLYFLNGEGYTYKSFGEKTYRIARLLAKYGLKPGDKVGLLSQNMPNWPVAFFATAAFGMVTVPMLPDFSESDVRFIIKHSETHAIFVSRKLFSKISEKSISHLSLIIFLDDFEVMKGTASDSPQELISGKSIHPDDLASIIYTSGTTGSSKGVMLSHRNHCANLHSAQELRPSFPSDVWLSILPLSHTLESSLSLMLPMLAGGSVYYIEKPPTPSILMKAFDVVHPTSILSVPLIMEKIYKSSILPVFNKNKFTSLLYHFYPTKILLIRIAGKKLKAKFGGSIRFFGIGGAKLDRDVEKFLLQAHFPYAIGYGLTETSPLIAGAIPQTVRLGSTGPIVSGVQAKLLNKDSKTGIGEIVVKGDNVMQGYYHNESATKDAFTEDGWFRTKDLGMFDKDGWLYIKGRSSSTIIGPSGENIYPEEIESVINSHSLVNESVVTSNKGKLTAIINFNKEKMASMTLKDIKKELLDYVNEKVNKFSRINNIEEKEDEFEKTATHKIKRYLYTKK